jgi:hypothetical protein
MFPGGLRTFKITIKHRNRIKRLKEQNSLLEWNDAFNIVTAKLKADVLLDDRMLPPQVSDPLQHDL